MTQFEFESLTKVKVSADEFWAINDVYLSSDLDKEAFCKMWRKMNTSRVAKAKEEAKAAKAKEALLDKLYKIADIKFTASSSDLWSKLAPEFISYPNQMWLESLGIDMQYEAGAFGFRAFKTIGTVCYEVEQYIKKVINHEV